MQSSFKTSLILFSALMVCASNLSTASYQTKPLSCRADNSMKIVASVGSVASMRLGKNYEFGEGVSEDYSQAFEWYCNAAMQNNANAQLKIALFLLEGKGNQKNVSAGLTWLNRAANNGSHDAELALGVLLVDTDAIRSAVLFKRAAAGGNLYANHRLAELYYYGMGVPQNYFKAQELSEIGVAAGFEKSKELLTRIQIKQDSGVFQSSPTASVIEPVVTAVPVAIVEPQPELQQEIQKESQKELQSELQNESQKSNSLFQRFLSILPSLPNMGGAGVSDPSEVTVTTSNAVEIKAQSEEQIPSVTESVVVIHPVTVLPVVSVVQVSVPEVVMVKSESRSPDLNQQALEDELVVAAAIEEHASATPVVAKAVSAKAKLAERPFITEYQPVIKDKAAALAVSKKQTVVSANEHPDSGNYARDAGWINKQPDMRYAIQLVQATQLDGIFKYIKNHDLDENAYYIHALQDGEYRYILLYGNYPNNRTSKKVAKSLPGAVQAAGYWIRTFGDLRRSYVISP